MSIRVLVNGSQGKMGQEVIKVIQNNASLNLVATSGKNDNLYDKIKSSQAEVVIDFTTPSAVYENTQTIIKAGAHPIIGTTGLTSDQVEKLKQACAEKKLGGIIAPNFSIGAVLMMLFSKQAAQYFPNVEIIEFHHTAKKDSPSGTAVKTADMIAEAHTIAAPQQAAHEIVAGARGAVRHNVTIHAVRLPGFVASQEVIFGGLGETLRISHNPIHREAFMEGILLACKKVMALDRLVFGLEHIL